MNKSLRSIPTPTIKLSDYELPNLYVKREDMIPYSFGGNKARKAILFFDEIDKGGYDYVVTYGSSHSNHCRVVANQAAARGIPCLIIGPDEVSVPTYNSKMMDLFGAEMISVPTSEVSRTIDEKLDELKASGANPYFITGGGHGNIGTKAYVNCYNEIRHFEKENNVKFDYIFFATGTGTTQAGLVCGQIIHGDDVNIVGISIARKNPRGRDVVVDSIRDYFREYTEELSCKFNDNELEKLIQDKTIFIDDYTGDGYGKDSPQIQAEIRESLIKYGMPLDTTYTGKAFWGMKDYIRQNGLWQKNILFIHTGGTPLFFYYLGKM